MKQKTQITIKRILSAILAVAMVLTSVFTDFVFKPFEVEAKGTMSWLKNYNADVIYGPTTNPDTKPAKAAWVFSINHDIMQTAVSKDGMKYTENDGQNWYRDTGEYDCSNFVYWAIIEGSDFAASTNNANQYSYQQVIDAGVLKEGTIISSGYGGNHTAMVVGTISKYDTSRPAVYFYEAGQALYNIVKNATGIKYPIVQHYAETRKN